jgi:signal transduction histidine kinase/ActR/RegA family two-component response regulator
VLAVAAAVGGGLDAHHLGILAAPAAAQPLPPPQPQRPPPVAGDTIAVGVLDRFPPFYEWDEARGRPVGLDADLLAEIERTTGLRVRWRRFSTFPDLLAALKAGEIRVATATAQTADRASFLRFTRPYAAVQQAFMGPAHITSVPSTPDLSGRRVAVVKGFVSESIAIERFPAASRPTYASLDAALDALQRGEADFVLEALPTLKTLAAERKAADWAILRTYGFPEGYMRLATGLGDAELARQLDAALAQAEAGPLKLMLDRWLPADAGPALPAKAPPGVAALRIGYLPADRPFTLRLPGGEADGIAIRMMRRVAELAGIPIASFEPMNLNDGLAALREGRLDLMLGLTDVAARREQMVFVGPYRANPLVIVSRGQYSIWSLHQLAGQRMGMIRGYFAIPYVQSVWPTVRIVECESFDECRVMLDQDRIAATVYGLQGAFDRIGPSAGSTMQITGTVPGLYDEHNIGLTLARASLAPLLRDALNVVLDREIAGIESAWAEQQRADGVDWRRIRIAAGVAVLVLLATACLWWLHSRRLRREIGRTEAARAQSEEYLAFMTHEVRNALQSVSGAVAMLRSSLGGRIDAATAGRLRPLLDAVSRSTRSTLSLLDALLDRHRLHEGRLTLDLRPESLERVLRAVVDEIAPMAQAKGLALRFVAQTPLAGWWRTDALRVQLIVRNLLVNAVKFSPQGEIQLLAALEPAPGRPGDWRTARVEVVDQGQGMSAAQQALAFKRFSTTGGDRPGSGLGLHLCQDLAAALGGALSFDSEAGRGSRFTVSFPVQAAAAGPAASDGSIHRVLVVEDSPVFALLIGEALQRQGVNAVIAESVAQARSALLPSDPAGSGAPQPFELLLSDANLEDGTVDDVLQLLREAAPAGGKAPVVLCMSAYVDEATRSRLLAAGVDEVLAKDEDVAMFVTRVLATAVAVRVERAGRR